MAASVYVTKYQAGGSGDNYIPDGYIKSVEKYWIDTYTIGFTNTNTTIDIAVVQPNKKIIGIDVEIETSLSQTSGTISIGFSTDSIIDTFLAATTLSHNLTRTSISLPRGVFQGNVAAGGSAIAQVAKIAGFQLVTAGTQTTISIKLNNWTMTTGTVKTRVIWG